MAHARMCGAIDLASDGSSQPAALSHRQQQLYNTLRACVDTGDSSSTPSRRRGPRLVFWHAWRLLMASVVMVWSPHATLTDSFAQARGLWPAQMIGLTYQGLIKALRRKQQVLFTQAAAEIHRQLIDAHEARTRIFGFFVLAVDGSRFALPRSESNTKAMGTISGEGSLPQMMVTQWWQVGLALPWLWRSGPGAGDERADLAAMIDQTPAGCLILVDAGFTGYDTLRAVIDSGRHIVLRACGGLSLLRGLQGVGNVKKRGKRVYLWPAYAQRAGDPPVELRLHCVCGSQRNRKGESIPPVWVVTSVLDHRRLSGKKLGILFRMRWGVEVCYRTLKQTLDRHRLRSRSSTNALLELQSLMLGLLVLGRLAVAQVAARGKRAACDWSPARALRIMRNHLPAPMEQCSWSDLAQAVSDRHERGSKKVREQYPRKKEYAGPTGEPKVRDATAAERARYAEMTK